MSDDHEWDDKYFYYDDMTISEKAIVSHVLVQKFGELISCHTLIEKKATAKVFEWRGQNWIAVSGVSSGVTGYTQVDIRRVTLANETCLPVNNPRMRGEAYYTGWRFRSQKKEWAIDAYELELHSECYAKIKQGVLL